RREELSAVADRIKDGVKGIIASWQRIFGEVIRCKKEGKRVSFYGQGTTLMIVLSNTEFPKEQIIGVYDDNPHKIGEVVWGIEVKPFCEEIKQADAVVLCAGPEGISFMKKTLGDYGGIIIHL
ncbi:hypothetical protein KA005_78525, partial [bacterium]|nr:hypothetical protein [bacterium]